MRVNLENLQDKEKTQEINFVGVNFKENISLSKRYEDYLIQNESTNPDILLSLYPDCVVIGTPLDPLLALDNLNQRNGFSRCSGRIFAGNYLTQGEDQFLLEIQDILPLNSRVRVHCYPPTYSKQLLDNLDLSKVLKENSVLITPSTPTHLLVALLLDNSRVCWGVYTDTEYKERIARPGDGDPNHVFSINFNKAQAKIAESVQLLSETEKKFLFDEELLVVDVGAAPGGWSAYLAALSQVSVISVDPAELEPNLLNLPNLRHLKLKAEDVVGGCPTPLQVSAAQLCGENWTRKYRLLICDANLDVRDSVRDLVLPLTSDLLPGGILVITLKLGRRVGEEGILRKVEAVKRLLITAGIEEVSIRTVWLFSNSKNERTVLARKPFL
ncbi:uncharacterized protein LOC111697802 [Eurytemora carolleeae]|uniref:uncharacterized protein LOC111697802 n=1 Tax=Eurytemora carolleeae TaxID=1294199 RepID=UPI000C78FCD9|nr:uncharacterized protein LOC111697802 [Eurytemora carolleeae]|eukprot:XP_023323698.1 uncharacterized protein LOC111697802 [Eurytemora affinis]